MPGVSHRPTFEELGHELEWRVQQNEHSADQQDVRQVLLVDADRPVERLQHENDAREQQVPGEVEPEQLGPLDAVGHEVALGVERPADHADGLLEVAHSARKQVHRVQRQRDAPDQRVVPGEPVGDVHRHRDDPVGQVGQDVEHGLLQEKGQGDSPDPVEPETVFALARGGVRDQPDVLVAVGCPQCVVVFCKNSVFLFRWKVEVIRKLGYLVCHLL